MRIDDLPGELLIWILIISELLIFAAGLTAMASVRLTDPEGFAAAQSLLDGRAAVLNTLLLVTSGFFAAKAERATKTGAKAKARHWLLAAMVSGAGFLVVKGFEYAADFRAGADIDGHPFFMFYFLLTGFHAAHVIAGIVVMGIIAIRARADAVQAGVEFWHMVDLVWILLLPPVYLLG